MGDPVRGEYFADQSLPFVYSASQTRLPVYSRKDEIIESIIKNQVTIISAATGSGKSTQIPLYILEFNRKALILCSQTKRAAAKGLCRSVQALMNGVPVGYHFRGESDIEGKNIVYLTEGNF
jgi:HrpA-like RNA helicase